MAPSATASRATSSERSGGRERELPHVPGSSKMRRSGTDTGVPGAAAGRGPSGSASSSTGAHANPFLAHRPHLTDRDRQYSVPTIKHDLAALRIGESSSSSQIGHSASEHGHGFRPSRAEQKPGVSESPARGATSPAGSSSKGPSLRSRLFSRGKEKEKGRDSIAAVTPAEAPHLPSLELPRRGSSGSSSPNSLGLGHLTRSASTGSTSGTNQRLQQTQQPRQQLVQPESHLDDGGNIRKNLVVVTPPPFTPPPTLDSQLQLQEEQQQQQQSPISATTSSSSNARGSAEPWNTAFFPSPPRAARPKQAPPSTSIAHDSVSPASQPVALPSASNENTGGSMARASLLSRLTRRQSHKNPEQMPGSSSGHFSSSMSEGHGGPSSRRAPDKEQQLPPLPVSHQQLQLQRGEMESPEQAKQRKMSTGRAILSSVGMQRGARSRQGDSSPRSTGSQLAPGSSSAAHSRSTSPARSTDSHGRQGSSPLFRVHGLPPDLRHAREGDAREMLSPASPQRRQRPLSASLAHGPNSRTHSPSTSSPPSPANTYRPLAAATQASWAPMLIHPGLSDEEDLRRRGSNVSSSAASTVSYHAAVGRPRGVSLSRRDTSDSLASFATAMNEADGDGEAGRQSQGHGSDDDDDEGPLNFSIPGITIGPDDTISRGANGSPATYGFSSMASPLHSPARTERALAGRMHSSTTTVHDQDEAERQHSGGLLLRPEGSPLNGSRSADNVTLGSSPGSASDVGYDGASTSTIANGTPSFIMRSSIDQALHAGERFAGHRGSWQTQHTDIESVSFFPSAISSSSLDPGESRRSSLGDDTAFIDRAVPGPRAKEMLAEQAAPRSSAAPRQRASWSSPVLDSDRESEQRDPDDSDC